MKGEGTAHAARSKPLLRGKGGTQRFDRVRYVDGPSGYQPESVTPDDVAVEEPLEIRIAGESFVITMRTPGHDRELAAGLLLGEGIIASRDDLGAIVHCGRIGDEGYGNAIEVTPAGGARIAWERVEDGHRRGVVTSACGVCGRQSIDDLLQRCVPLGATDSMAAEVLARLPASLFRAQATFRLTGGVHAAGLASPAGEIVASFEDVGRHNAVDKLFGHWLLTRGVPATGHILVVSGRASFEIVQKAIVSRCSALVSVSAPSSLAIATARKFGLALVGFVRAGSFNVYAGAERVK